MPNQESTVWGIHAGRTGEADRLFLGTSSGCIALGWPEMEDLATLRSERDAFKARMATVYPAKKPGAIPVEAGQLFRFVHEMKSGEIVAYPSKKDHQIHLGRVDGPYRYDPGREPEYPHRRLVKWLRAVPRTHFSQGALYEIGSAMAVFQVNRYADEYLAALEGKLAEPPSGPDETAAPVAEEIEQNTSDFVLKQLARELKGHPLAEFVAHLLGTMGYRTRVSPEGPDGGVDIVAHRDELGFDPPIIKVQVKSGEGTISDSTVSALYGKVGSSEFGLFIALGVFSPQARSFAQSRANLRLIDGQALVGLMLQHYEQFDARYKGLIPLRRVYVPEPLEGEG